MQNLKTKCCLVISITLLIGGLCGCGQVDHEPQSGEYGQTLVNSIQLTNAQIVQMNQSEMPRPEDTFKRPQVGINFPVNAEKNPYRFVIVAKGHAIQQGKVDLQWIGGIRAEETAPYHPEIFREEDDHRYDINQPVLLVISSDPFSIASDHQHSQYSAFAELTQRENFAVESVQLQVWQGKGALYSWTAYLKFVVILLVVLAAIYRLISR